jgi:hypothetical protein
MAKRIQMRKNRFMAIQKIAESKKVNLEAANPPGPPGDAPKQTVSIASQNPHATWLRLFLQPSLPWFAKTPLPNMGQPRIK